MTEPRNAPPPIEVIAAGDMLWRRLHRTQIVSDSQTGAERVSSAAFTDPQLSVDLARLVRDDDYRVTMGSSAGVAAFAASVARELGLAVEHAPEPDNGAHTHVLGKKTESIRRRLSRNSMLLNGAASGQVR